MIVHLANIARACKRDSDVLARIGGEEFAVLLPETDLPGAQLMAERLRVEVASSPLTDVPAPIASTVSIGVADADPGMADFARLMKAADDALYDAKRSGRNRVTCSISREIAPNIAPGCCPPQTESAGT
jgi:diguanylate cyclase (GGDEF)-like protein